MNTLSDAVRRACLVAAVCTPVALAACGGGGGGGGGSADTTAPKVASKSPDAGATGVALNRTITVAFDEEVDCARTVSKESFMVVAGAAALDGTVLCSDDKRSATFRPQANMAPDTVHTATVTKAVTDKAGNHLAAPVSWTFTTGAAPDTTPPTVVAGSELPKNSDSKVSPDASLSISFDESMDCDSLKKGFTLKDAADKPAPGTVSCSADLHTAIFDPTGDLAANVKHTATVAAGVARDTAGNALATGYAWAFTTGAAIDRIAPTVKSTLPQNNDIDVVRDGTVKVVFSEPVLCDSVNDNSLTLAAGGVSVAARVTSCSGDAAVFTPALKLAPTAAYTATIAGVKDASNNVAASHSWTFNTMGRAWSTAVSEVEYAINDATLPQVAFVKRGEALVVWQQVDGRGESGILFRGYGTAGGWDAAGAQFLEDIATDVKLASDGKGNAMAVWVGGPHIYSNAYTNGAWQPKAAVDATTGAFKSFPEVALDGNGKAVALWGESQGTYRQPRTATTDASGIWSSVVPITSGTTDAYPMRLALGSKGNGAAVFTQYPAGVSTVYLSKYDGAGNWSSSTRKGYDPLANGYVATKEPGIAVDAAGNPVMVWAQKDAGSATYSIWCSYGAAQTYGVIEQLTDDFSNPTIVTDAANHAYAVWQSNNAVFVNDAFNADSGFDSTKVQSISTALFTVKHPSAALAANGDLLVVWAQQTGAGKWSIWVNRRSAAGVWEGAKAIVEGLNGTVDTTGGISIEPRVAVDDIGNAVVVWGESDGAHDHIQAKQFD